MEVRLGFGNPGEQSGLTGEGWSVEEEPAGLLPPSLVVRRRMTKLAEASPY